MSIFGTILEKLGIQKPAAKPAAPAASPKPAAGMAPAKPSGMSAAAAMSHMNAHDAPSGMPASAPKPAPMAMVDVVGKLEKMAGDKSGLDWKVSIVDMLKLLEMDSSLEARKELAKELGCPQDLIGGDYAKMNVWLHETVLQKIAENGGNIPASLLKK
jgi:Domain of unknown function (DUF3597)